MHDTQTRQAGRPVARSATASRTAILVATASAGGEAAACLPCVGTTVLGRLVQQLGELDTDVVHVITRPQWRTDVQAALHEPVCVVHVHTSDGVPGDLRLIAELAPGPEAGLVVADAGLVVHRGALAGLLRDARVPTGVLTGAGGHDPGAAPPIRIEGGTVRSAGSPYHLVGRPTAGFLGVLKVAGPARAPLAEAADELARLTAHGSLGVSVGALPGEDVVATLLVGLVRRGAEVRTAPLRAFAWARPVTAEAATAAGRAAGHRDDERARLDSAVKSTDGFFTTFFVSPYSKHLARFAARRGWSPNAVTTVSMAIGLLAAAAFATGERWGLVAGALALQAAFVADCVDGQVARYAQRFSALGGWLDSIFDRAKEYAVFAGLAIGASRRGDDVWLLAGAALTLQTMRHMLDFSFHDGARPGAPVTRQPPLDQAQDAELVAIGARAGGAAAGPPGGRAAQRQGPAAKLLGLITSVDRIAWVPWVKRVVAFPIGERFAVISITAALFTPRTTFVVLLAWAAFACVYTNTGRLLRSVGPGSPSQAQALALFRDDGPLALALGRASASLGRVQPVLLVAAGLLPGIVVVLARGDAVSWPVAAALVAWLVALGGVASGRPDRARRRWLVPALLRMGEYGGLLSIASLSARSAVPAAFALIAVLAFRHYDLVYRLRGRRASPPALLGVLAGGWDGRLVAGVALLAVGALRAGMFVLAAVLATVFVMECARDWLHFARAGGPMLYDADEEDGDG